jgi:4-hydroxy-tetrahydrodipicolinate reductase
MNIALIGYGKMGKLIEQLAPGQVRLKLDEFNNAAFEGISRENFQGIDVAIDFSIPSAAVENIERISALGVNIVVGTTGWFERLDHIRSVIEKNKTGLVWSPNFSIGVNAFFLIVSEAARLMANESAYEPWAYEIHHSTKKDAPSGTLLKLVEEMKKAGYSQKIDVSSNRAGAHPGTHEIGFDSPADTITLRHVARSREGFAQGALRAAQWLVGKKGFYEFSDIVFNSQQTKLKAKS